MIENLTVESAAVLMNYLGLGYCLIQLGWALFHGKAKNAAIYGIAIFAAFIVAINMGGVLNDTTWSWFGIGIFGANMIYNLSKRIMWKVGVYALLAAVNTIVLIGVI